MNCPVAADPVTTGCGILITGGSGAAALMAFASEVHVYAGATESSGT